jgi:hypothetical protein
MGTLGTHNGNVALALARAGYSVFPCHAGGEKAKQPMPFIKWRDVSTTDERTIFAWWQKWPGAAVGIDLAKSRLIVIDADRHGDADGVAAFGELMAAHGFEPDGVPTVATPNHGTHFYFRQPSGKELGNATGQLPKGVDVRGFGGYVLAPGVILEDGREYEGFGDPATAPELPGFVVELIEAGKVAAPAPAPLPAPVQRTEISDARIRAYCDAAISGEIARVAQAGAGTRNHTLNQSAFALGQLCGAGWVSTGEIEALLTSAAFGIGLQQPEISKTIRSGLQAGMKEPRTIADLPVDPIAPHALFENANGDLYNPDTGEVFEVMKPSAPVGPGQYPPGLVGDIAKWIVATARRPQPELAIAAALVLVGTAAGRLFAGPTKSATHLYVLGLAPTAGGKDHPLQMIARIMMQTKPLENFLGPSEFISMPAVIKFIMRKALSLCAMDEFGSFMARINSKRASGFEQSIAKILRQMWSQSFTPYITPEWASIQAETINSPALSIYGTSTPEQFYKAMEGAAIEDGTLNRFLLVNGREDVDEVDPEIDSAKVPFGIQCDLQFVFNRIGDLGASARFDRNVDPVASDAVIYVPWCNDGSHELYKAFSAEVSARQKEGGPFAALWGRTVEIALRIATIVAIGRLEGEDRVRKSDLEFGIMLARASAEQMVNGAREYMAENQNQADAQKIVRLLRQRGGRMKVRDLKRALQHTIKKRDLDSLFGEMRESGQLVFRDEPSASGPPSPMCYLEKDG